MGWLVDGNTIKSFTFNGKDKSFIELVFIDVTKTPGFWCFAATTTDLPLALCASQETRKFTVDARQSYPTNDWPRVVNGPQAPGVKPVPKMPAKSYRRPPGMVVRYPRTIFFWSQTSSVDFIQR